MSFDWRSLYEQKSGHYEGVPNKYRSQPDFRDLVKDADHGGDRNRSSVFEAVTISEARWHHMIGPGLQRAESPDDFVDETGRLYDVKTQYVKDSTSVLRSASNFTDALEDQHDDFARREAEDPSRPKGVIVIEQRLLRDHERPAFDQMTQDFARANPDRPVLLVGLKGDPRWLNEPKDGPLGPDGPSVPGSGRGSGPAPTSGPRVGGEAPVAAPSPAQPPAPPPALLQRPGRAPTPPRLTPPKPTVPPRPGGA